MLSTEEINAAWCFGLVNKCSPSEAMGLWSVLLFYTSVLVVSLIHVLLIPKQSQSTGGTTMRSSSASVNEDLKMICGLVVYFFTFTMGCLVWALNSSWAHPFQSCPIQILGSAMLLICTGLFIKVHVDLGDSWYPLPDQPPQLVTHGIFQYARHPMYAVFLWASIATLLATLNWVIAWCVSGTVLVTFARIKTEDRILIGLFGECYLEYARHVSALGPPWQCLGYDKQTSNRIDYSAIE